MKYLFVVFLITVVYATDTVCDNDLCDMNLSRNACCDVYYQSKRLRDIKDLEFEDLRKGTISLEIAEMDLDTLEDLYHSGTRSAENCIIMSRAYDLLLKEKNPRSAHMLGLIFLDFGDYNEACKYFSMEKEIWESLHTDLDSSYMVFNELIRKCRSMISKVK